MNEPDEPAAIAQLRAFQVACELAEAHVWEMHPLSPALERCSRCLKERRAIWADSATTVTTVFPGKLWSTSQRLGSTAATTITTGGGYDNGTATWITLPSEDEDDAG